MTTNISSGSNRISGFCAETWGFHQGFFSHARFDNFLFVPTANNNLMPLWGMTDYQMNSMNWSRQIEDLNNSSWPRFAAFIQGLRAGSCTDLQITHYNKKILTKPVRLAGGYWPGGCAGSTKIHLERHGVPVEPIDKLMYIPGVYRSK